MLAVAVLAVLLVITVLGSSGTIWTLWRVLERRAHVGLPAQGERDPTGARNPTNAVLSPPARSKTLLRVLTSKASRDGIGLRDGLPGIHQGRACVARALGGTSGRSTDEKSREALSRWAAA